MPQPVVAVPSFMFVTAFRALLPVALGFAAGCMVWMVFAELLPDALEGAAHGKVSTIIVPFHSLAFLFTRHCLMPLEGAANDKVACPVPQGLKRRSLVTQPGDAACQRCTTGCCSTCRRTPNKRL